MKENFSIVIESYHIADRGTQENVSDVVLKMYWHKIRVYSTFYVYNHRNQHGCKMLIHCFIILI